jgi:hypothetical protein
MSETDNLKYAAKTHSQEKSEAKGLLGGTALGVRDLEGTVLELEREPIEPENHTPKERETYKSSGPSKMQEAHTTYLEAIKRNNYTEREKIEDLGNICYNWNNMVQSVGFDQSKQLRLLAGTSSVHKNELNLMAETVEEERIGLKYVFEKYGDLLGKPFSILSSIGEETAILDKATALLANFYDSQLSNTYNEKETQKLLFFYSMGFCEESFGNTERSLSLVHHMIDDPLKTIVANLHESVKNNNPLSDAMKKHPSYFNPRESFGIFLGEETGNLPRQFYKLGENLIKK